MPSEAKRSKYVATTSCRVFNILTVILVLLIVGAIASIFYTNKYRTLIILGLLGAAYGVFRFRREWAADIYRCHGIDLTKS